jgi:hypothetical protein
MELITTTHPLLNRSAVFSPCRTYRYRLQETFVNPSRGRDGGALIGPTQAFLMLNPSTADEMQDDPTVGRCHTRAIASGFARFEVINLFGLRSTDPQGLYSHPEPVGAHNDAAILECAQATLASGGQLVCAWGNHGAFAARAAQVVALLRAHHIPLHALKLNANGSPAHPLYLPASLVPVPFNPA